MIEIIMFKDSLFINEFKKNKNEKTGNYNS